MDKSFANKVREKEDEIVGHEWLKQEYRNLKGTIEQRLEKIEERLGIKDPYAEAKQAYKDGCLQYKIYGQWFDCDPNTYDQPFWELVNVNRYRRKPEEKSFDLIIGCLDQAQDVLKAIESVWNLREAKLEYRGRGHYAVVARYTKK